MGSTLRENDDPEGLRANVSGTVGGICSRVCEQDVRQRQVTGLGARTEDARVAISFGSTDGIKHQQRVCFEQLGQPIVSGSFPDVTDNMCNCKILARTIAEGDVAIIDWQYSIGSFFGPVGCIPGHADWLYPGHGLHYNAGLRPSFESACGFTSVPIDGTVENGRSCGLE